MSRSSHNGCGRTCGVCKPHKKWPSTDPTKIRGWRKNETLEFELTATYDEGDPHYEADLGYEDYEDYEHDLPHPLPQKPLKVSFADLVLDNLVAFVLKRAS